MPENIRWNGAQCFDKIQGAFWHYPDGIQHLGIFNARNVDYADILRARKKCDQAHCYCSFYYFRIYLLTQYRCRDFHKCWFFGCFLCYNAATTQGLSGRTSSIPFRGLCCVSAADYTRHCALVLEWLGKMYDSLKWITPSFSIFVLRHWVLIEVNRNQWYRQCVCIHLYNIKVARKFIFNTCQ